LVEKKGTITLACFLIFFLASFAQVDAKFFDFFEKILGKTNESVSSMGTSQTIPLLNAPLNFNLLDGMGGGNINIVQDSALLSVTGPLGTIADVALHKSDQISLYVVRDGDTISDIAKVFGVSANTIRWANELKSGSIISPGQILVILPVTGIQYTVKKGDTIGGIAKKFGGDSAEIISFNGLSLTSALEAGSTLVIPNGEATEPARSLAQNSPSRTSRVSGPLYAGYYIRPISGGIRTQGIHGYNGVDLANSCESPIMAAAGGDVIISKSQGWNSGYGQYVAISHPNGTQTLYAHMSLILVAPGFHVVQGQVIGYVGSTGLSTGCHVHFEVRGARNPF